MSCCGWSQSTSNPPECCEGIATAIVNVSLVLDHIANILDERLGKPCDHIEDCLDKIIQGINAKYAGALKSCETCKGLQEAGLANTLEYAITCAHCACTECEKKCSVADSTTWGKQCTGCGCEPCICNDGVCEPVDPAACDTNKWKAWCNPLTASPAVTAPGAVGLGPPFVQVGMADTEAAAQALAIANCHITIPPVGPPPPHPIPPLSLSFTCPSPQQYMNGGALAALGADSNGAFLAGAISSYAQSLGEFGIGGVNLENIGELFSKIFITGFSAPAIMASQIVPAMASALGCHSEKFKGAAQVLTAFGTAEKYVGSGLDEFLTPWRYAMHAECRQKLLPPSQAVSAFLANSIDYAKMDSYWAVEGFCPEALADYIHAAKSKPDSLELVTMRFRELISSSEYHIGMREIGYLDRGTAENLFNVRKQLPTMSDLIRFMVRDTADVDLANTLHSNDQFDIKFTGDIVDWTKWQGIDQKFMEHEWRAHWTIPSPGQLFEFYHRLRHNPAFGTEGEQLDLIKKALVQQDILPFWQDKYLAVSFRPLTRVDLRRAFNIGAIDENELEEGFIQIGYSDDNAKRQVKFSIRLRDIAAQGHKAIKLWQKFRIDGRAARQRMIKDGLPDEVVDNAMSDSEYAFATSYLANSYVKGDIAKDDFRSALQTHGVSDDGVDSVIEVLSGKIVSHPSVKAYTIGMISEDQARSAMRTDGLRTSIIDRLLSKADIAFAEVVTIACQRGIKRRYIKGELDATEAVAELENRSTVSSRAGSLVDAWNCERAARGKTETAAQLCDWLAKGIIDSVDFNERLVRLGYKPEVAAMIVESCLISVSAKRLANEKKLAKEDAAVMERGRRALERAAAAQGRATKALITATQRAAKTRGNREKQLLSAAAKLTPKCECDIVDALAAVKLLYPRIEIDYALTKDQALQVLITAAEEWAGGSLSEFRPIAFAMAEVAASVPTPDLAEIV